MKLPALLACLLAPLFCTAETKPLLWKIEGAKPSYVFGTIHLASKDVTTLAPATEKAVAAADALFTEIPMDMAAQMQSAMKLLGGGRPLKEVLPADLYARAEAEVQRINPALTLQPFEKMEVWALAVTIALLEEQLKNPGAQVLDAVLYAKAEAARKTVGGLETPEEQFAVFAKFSTEDQIAMLRATLDDMAKARQAGRKPLDEMRLAYLSGDLAKIDQVMNEWTASLDDDLEKRFLDALITQRNRHMAERMAAKLRAEPDKSFFFAVGAAHLHGPDGVLALLEKAGLKLARTQD
jgi:uncharacterized protein YbaP (TraB family)